MIFEEEKYYKYISTLEKTINIMYAIYIFIFGMIGLAMGKVTGLIIGILFGILISTIVTLKTKIQIQEMKWKIDIHRKITCKENI